MTRSRAWLAEAQSATPDLVTIAIPTYNRASLLERAVESARRQDYGNVQIIICDNASTDGTQTYCKSLIHADHRIHYIRHLENLGSIGNFESALPATNGLYFMWLADDDWIDVDYIRKCVGALQSDRHLSLVVGRAILHQPDGSSTLEPSVDITDDDPAIRVLRFYETVGKNSVFYGMSLTSHRRNALPLNRRVGEDWRIVAQSALGGHVRTLPDTWLHRSVGGESADLVRFGQSLGMGLRARAVYLHIAAWTFHDIAFGPGYAQLEKGQRRALALRSWLIILRTRTIRFAVSRIVGYASAVLAFVLPRSVYQYVTTFYHRAIKRPT